VAKVVERVTTSPEATPSVKQSQPPQQSSKAPEGVDGWVPGPIEGESDDEEYEDDEEDEEDDLEEDLEDGPMNHTPTTLPEFTLPADVGHKPPRDLQVRLAANSFTNS
jgi:hypothetical protein